MRVRVAGAVVAAVLCCAAPAGAGSLPAVSTGHRPGPAALYEPAPRAPQLENTGVWKADPILVSGATAYRSGEFLYQDFLYDAHGAAGVKDPTDPFTTVDFTFSPKAGTLTNPSDPAFANDSADLVELRAKPLADATAFRITLNTLSDPDRTATTIAIGTSAVARAWPHGAGVSSPAQLFLTVHGTTAELVDAAGGTARTPAPTATVDAERRQVTVTVPHAAWDPGTSVVRLAAGVGLWDVAGDRYLAPDAVRSPTAPGGASPTGARLFNLAFRGSEPVPDLSTAGAGVTIADAAAGAAVLGTWWREKQQSDALASNDASPFHADVDFGKLAAGTDDDSGVPKTGPMDRIMASHRVFGQGIDYTKLCGGLTAATAAYKPCEGALVGQLQPYAIYVPGKPEPAAGYGLTLLLHSLSANYNQYLGSKNQSQLGERGNGSIVVTPAGRGPDGFYRDVAEADTFEVWADVARHYRLDPGWAAVSGYSMGGLGTFHLLARWPDLFARGFSVVGAGDPDEDLASLRNTPIMMWNAAADELVNLASSQTTQRALERLGLRFTADLFLAADHLTLATNDEYGKGAAFLGNARVVRNPAHVVYVIDPETDSDRAASRADHAYWLSDLRVRDGQPRGTIDIRSAGFGRGDAPLGELRSSTGTLEGGSRGPTPYTERSRSWGTAPLAPKADRLIVHAVGVAAATVDARRARVSCAPEIELHTDGPLDLRVACTPPEPRACAKRIRVAVPRVRGRKVRSVVVRRSGGKVLRRTQGRNLRRVTVKRPTRRAFTLRLRARTGGPKPVTVTVLRRVRAC